MCPRVPGWLVGQKGQPQMVAHCLVLETDADGLVLIDTGFGSHDVASPTRVPRMFRALMQPALNAQQTALAQLSALGYHAQDVRHIVLTHLDLDHAGGLGDFPDAIVHVHRREHRAAMERHSRSAKQRYLPIQWQHAPQWALYDTDGDTWRGMPAIRQLRNLREDLALLPLHGHTQGHSAVLVATATRWLVHAGDAYFHRDTLRPSVDAPWGLRTFEAAMQTDKAARLASVAALQALQQAHQDVTVFCAHDPVELAALQHAQA